MLTLNNLNYFELPPPQQSPETGESNQTTENFAAILGGISALLQNPESEAKSSECAATSESADAAAAFSKATADREIHSSLPHALDHVAKITTPAANFPAKTADLKPETVLSTAAIAEVSPTEIERPQIKVSTLAENAAFEKSAAENSSIPTESGMRRNVIKFNARVTGDETDFPVDLEIPAETQAFQAVGETENAEVEILEIPKDAKVLPFVQKNPEPNTEILIDENRSLDYRLKQEKTIGINPHQPESLSGNAKFGELNYEQPKIRISDLLEQFPTEEIPIRHYHFDLPEINQMDFEAPAANQTDLKTEVFMVEPAVEAVLINAAQAKSETPVLQAETEAFDVNQVNENLKFQKPVADIDKSADLWEPSSVETPPIYDRQKADEQNKQLDPIETPPIIVREKVVVPHDLPKIVQAIRKIFPVKDEKDLMPAGEIEPETATVEPRIEKPFEPVQTAKISTFLPAEKGEVKFPKLFRQMPKGEIVPVKISSVLTQTVEPVTGQKQSPAEFWQGDSAETPPIIVREKPDVSLDFPKPERELPRHFPGGQKFELVETESAQIEGIELAELNLNEQIEPRLLELAGLVREQNEKQVLRMRLNPAELGAVEIRLEKNADGVLEARLETENEPARQALTQNLEKLREALQDSGWQIGRLEVTQQPSTSTAGQDREQPQDSENFPQKAPEKTFARRDEADGGAEESGAHRLVSLRA